MTQEKQSGWALFNEINQRYKQSRDHAGDLPEVKEPSKPPNLEPIDAHTLNTKELAHEIAEMVAWYNYTQQQLGRYQAQEAIFAHKVDEERSLKYLLYSGVDPETNRPKTQDRIKHEVNADPEIIELERRLKEVESKRRIFAADVETYRQRWSYFAQERRARLDSWHYDPENLRRMDMQREAEERLQMEHDAEKKVRERQGREW